MLLKSDQSKAEKMSARPFIWEVKESRKTLRVGLVRFFRLSRFFREHDSMLGSLKAWSRLSRHEAFLVGCKNHKMCAPCQDRTGDLQIMRLTLYQLSQRSVIVRKCAFKNTNALQKTARNHNKSSCNHTFFTTTMRTYYPHRFSASVPSKRCPMVHAKAQQSPASLSDIARDTACCVDQINLSAEN